MLTKNTMQVFAQPAVCYINLDFSKSSTLSLNVLTFIFITTLMAEDCRAHAHANSTAMHEDIWIEIRLLVRTVHAYAFVTTGSSNDNFPWMKRYPRNNCLHRITLTQASIGFYLMILWARVFPEVIYESLVLWLKKHSKILTVSARLRFSSNRYLWI